MRAIACSAWESIGQRWPTVQVPFLVLDFLFANMKYLVGIAVPVIG